MIDTLGDRMKEFYEDRTRIKLTRRTNTIIRIDGKAFHQYTKGFLRPFDHDLIEDMNSTAIYLCKNIQGAKFAYVQSDEISILVTDYDTLQTHAWFDNNLQKITSISASLATAKFNQLRAERVFYKIEIDPNEHGPTAYDMAVNEIFNIKLAHFDARVFQIPYREEVLNYFIWRQQDAIRNSISAVAQSLYSHKELNGKKTDVMQEMIIAKGVDWNDYSYREKMGTIIAKVQIEGPQGSIRNKWQAIETPIFTENRKFLYDLSEIK